ncbi:MAG: hypothetical protein KDA44_16440 [Planctomycetales bacterium]|nr:hypothetical protein [Planctomycetales bacterium]
MSATVPSAKESNNTVSVTSLVRDLNDTMAVAVNEINDINSNIQLLALNARIEAARAGQAGAAFSIVAQEMQSLSGKTSEAASGLANKTRHTIDELIDVIGNRITGTRLSDMALTNIDLIDRNLYERTCDVRWWATDSSLVDALAPGADDAARAHASDRMGVILNAYTVYYDLVLCDAKGRVVANGRPAQFQSVGADQSHAAWFREAMATSSGDEFGFQTAHASPLVDGKLALVYSCGVREAGRSDGRLLGALGIVFNWEALAQTILKQAPIDENQRAATRCAIIDETGALLADSFGKQLQGKVTLPNLADILSEKKNYVTCQVDGKRCRVGHAQAPGFETYSTGWHSIIIQPLTD